MNSRTETKAGELTGSRHTPGPWHVYESGIVNNTGFYRFRILNYAAREILETKTHVLGSTYDRLAADARLIAAAPELLEFARAYLDSESTTDKLDKMAKALIARVEGGAS